MTAQCMYANNKQMRSNQVRNEQHLSEIPPSPLGRHLHLPMLQVEDQELDIHSIFTYAYLLYVVTLFLLHLVARISSPLF